MGQKPPATLDAIAQRLDSLRRYIDSLDRSVQKLAAKLVPFDNEDEWLRLLKRPWMDPVLPHQPPYQPPPITLETIFDMVREANAHIDAIERDFASVRAKIELLQKTGRLGDELGPYIIPNKD